MLSLKKKKKNFIFFSSQNLNIFLLLIFFQASASAQRQVRQGAADVAVRGLSVVGDAGVVNSHVLTFR